MSQHVGSGAQERARASAVQESAGRRFEIDAEIELSIANVIIAQLTHDGPDRNRFRRERIYWLDLCLTPRRPNALARFSEKWSPSRFSPIGSIAAFPPRHELELRSTGGRHASVICEIQAQAVECWFPDDFTWTDRRLEAVLNITNEPIRQLMLRLNHELRRPQEGSSPLCEAIVQQLAIELARYLIAAGTPDAKGGLASWRLKLVDERITDPAKPYPVARELAELCRLSTRQFSRAFRASRGCTVSDFLAQTRIEMAKRRLGTAQPISEIAASLGFATQSSFTTAFRRSIGVTPAQFRKQWRKGQAGA
ncbi:MAG TPA: helix-turn-helix transcriptional regulator [Novosphingobium sp.]